MVIVLLQKRSGQAVGIKSHFTPNPQSTLPRSLQVGSGYLMNPSESHHLV